MIIVMDRLYKIWIIFLAGELCGVCVCVCVGTLRPSEYADMMAVEYKIKSHRIILFAGAKVELVCLSAI